MSELDAMSQMQKTAFDIWLNSADYSNNYTPITERDLASKMKTLGYEISCSAVNRWKSKFKWKDYLENKINLSLIENKDIKEIIRHSSLQTAVSNTKIDIERNSNILGTCYEIAEIEVAELLEKRQNGNLSKEDFKRFALLTKIFADRDDRMNDRLANISFNSVSGDDVLNRLETIEIEIETEDETEN